MLSLRSLAEQLTHRLILKRRLPEEFGAVPMFISTEGGLRFLRWRAAEMDPWLLGMARELVTPGLTVWDVGANVGLFSFAAAGLAGPGGSVLALEPDVCLVELLRRSSRLHEARRAPVDVLPVALADSISIARFHVACRARSANHLEGLGTSQTGGSREQQLVMTVTLDWLLERFPPPNIVKIDVEGAENLVLSGGTRLLSSVRPVILCEMSGEESEIAFRTLKSHRYTMCDADLPKAARRPIDFPAYNTIAYPT